MKDIKTVDPVNFRNVTVPLEISQIKEYFENKELFFLINYTDSKIKGNMFLTYISNLDLPCEIILKGASKEDRFELLKYYMETRNLNVSDALKYTAAQILLEKKGFDSTTIFDHPVLSSAECAEFIKNNEEMVGRWNTFISSTLIYTLTCIKDLEEEFSFKDAFKTIDDPHYIGSNVVQLFSVPSFLELFFSKPADGELFYMKPQFEEYMFRGKNLFHYFYCPENTLLLLFNEMLTGEKTLTDIQKMMSEAT